MTCDEYDYDYDCEYNDEYGEVDEYEDYGESHYFIPVRKQDDDTDYAESIPILYPQDPDDPWRGVPEATLKRIEEECFPHKRNDPQFNQTACILGIIPWPRENG